MTQKNGLDNAGEVCRVTAIVMNKSPSTSILTGLLALSALVSLVLCYLFIQYTREFRSLQFQTSNFAVKRNVVMSLANDTIEYSKKNPAILPILQAAGVPTTGAKTPTK